VIKTAGNVQKAVLGVIKMGIITKCAVCNRVIEKDEPSDLDICEECEMQEWDIEIDDEYEEENFW